MNNCKVEQEIREKLFALQDQAYRDFHCSLMPTVDPERVIGVRTPELKKLAKEYAKRPETADFLKMLPHKYYEENNIHGFLIAESKDYDTCIAELDRFLPYVDNWATCDLISPKVFKKHLFLLSEQAKKWIASDLIYVKRFGIKVLMSFFLDEAFDTAYLDLVAGIHSEEYYVNMMIAWYFATALAKQYEATVPYIENHVLDKFPHNKAIQKAVESFRVSDEQKAHLKMFRVK